MFTPAKEITESYRYVRDEWAAAGDLIETLAEFDILSVHLSACGEIHVDLDTTGLDRLHACIYRMQAAELLGLDCYDKPSQEWRGHWSGLYVAVRGYEPSAGRPFGEWLRSLIGGRE